MNKRVGIRIGHATRRSAYSFMKLYYFIRFAWADQIKRKALMSVKKARDHTDPEGTVP